MLYGMKMLVNLPIENMFGDLLNHVWLDSVRQDTDFFGKLPPFARTAVPSPTWRSRAVNAREWRNLDGLSYLACGPGGKCGL